MMYKIIHRIVDLDLPDYITFNRGITRGHDYILTMPLIRIDSYKFKFFPAITVIITLWKQLPNVAVSTTSINIFTNLVMQ